MRAFIVLGAVEGLGTALLAIGLVLVFKANRFINIAHAQLGVVSALVLGKLVLNLGVPWFVAIVPALAVGAAVGAATEILLIRRLANRSRIAVMISTVGLSQVLVALTFFEWLGPDRSKLVSEGYPVPVRSTAQLDELLLRGHQLTLLVVAPLVVAALAVFLTRTRVGRGIRAAASNVDGARLAGVPVERLSTVSWCIAGALSGLSAILAAPDQGSSSVQSFGPSLLLQALAAAAIGGFTSLPRALAGGVGLGVLRGIVLHETGDVGAANAVAFGVLLVALAAQRRTSLGLSDRPDVDDAVLRVPAAVAGRFLVRRARLVLWGTGLAVGIALPMLPPLRNEADQFLLALTLVFAIAGISVTVLAGWIGKVSLGQFALLGLGAFTAAQLVPNGWSLQTSILAAGAISALAAIVLALPAVRLGSVGTTATTLAFAVVGPGWLFRQAFVSSATTVTIAPPRILGIGPLVTQRSIYYAVLVVLVLVVAGLGALRRSAFGRVVVAVRDNPTGATALGISPTSVLISTFGLAGFLAGAAGALYLATYRNISVTQIDPQVSLLLLSIAVIGGLGSVSGAVVAAFAVFGLPTLFHDFLKSFLPNSLQVQLLFGGLGLIVTQVANPGGIAAQARRRWQAYVDRIDQEVPKSQPDAPWLAVDGVRVAFGGIQALDGASIEVGAGEIVGIIGTNGAGKSTLLNVISGLERPSAGEVRLLGRQITRLSPDVRANLGLGRTFQAAALFPGLSTLECVQVAAQRAAVGGLIGSLFGAPWLRSADRRAKRRAEELVERYGLGPWKHEKTDAMSTGTRRICALVCQVAAAPKVLLLDEPTAGVAQRDAEEFGPLLREIVAETGCSVLIVEHDMPLMLSIADRVYCMEQGRVIASGTPNAMRNDPVVIASYLGTDATSINRSNPTRRRRVRPAVSATT